VRRFAPLIPPGEVLDLACGGGRHSLLLASQDHRIIALDRDPVVLGRLGSLSGQSISPMLFDLEMAPGGGEPVWPFEANRFSGIVVTNYLHRALFPHIASSLALAGVLVYETFAVGNELFGKPSNPDFLLKRGELLGFAAKYSLQVIAFEEGYVDLPKPAFVQRICAVKAGPGLTAESVRLI
jgi:SAM-dependent methyltransferase